MNIFGSGGSRISVAKMGSALFALTVVAAACSDHVVYQPGGSGAVEDAGASEDSGQASGQDASFDAAVDACGVVPASKCKVQHESSVVRGIAHFDPTALAGKKGVNVALWLMHRQYASATEWTMGGHPHAAKYMQDVDLTTGSIPFSIDLCELGVAMYSEDDCDFNLVVILDENGNNNINADNTAIAVPDKGELTKLTKIDISCRGTSQCLDVTLDCADGQSCVAYTDPGACICGAQTCNSDAVTCVKSAAGD